MSLGNYTYFVSLLAAGLVLHAILWARNGRFLWSQRLVIARVVLIAVVYTLVADPIAGLWGAWYFNPDQVLGIWILRYVPIEDLFFIVVVSSLAACSVLVFGYSPRRWIW